MDLLEADKFGFREYLVSDMPISEAERALVNRPGDYRRLRFKFPNGYEASVIRIPYSYGYERHLWELAVLYKDKLVYITADVIGDLTPREVHEKLKQTQALEGRD